MVFAKFYGTAPKHRECPKKVEFVKTFTEVVDERVKELPTVKPLALMWSGGIDSTVAYYALKKANIEFLVVCNENSIKEYPKLGREVWEDSIHSLDFGKEKHKYTIVTGELGDQMVGSDTTLKFSYSERMKPYGNVLPSGLTMYSDEVIKVTEKEDMTTGEYLWALNFIFKYSTVQKRIKSEVMLGQSDVVHFYDSIDFQLWALSNFEKNSAYVKPTDYKSVYKDYIFQCNGDSYYRDNKTKVVSLQRNVFMSNF